MKLTCSTVLRRTLGVAGFVIGFGLLSAGIASADEGDLPGLLGGVAEPVLTPLTPVVDTTTEVLSPVLEPLQPVTAPLVTPVVNTVRGVPVVPRIADPLVGRSSTPAEAPPPPAEVPAVPQTPVVAPGIHAVAPFDAVPATVPLDLRQQQISAPDAAPPIEAPSPPSPDMPFALPGMTGSASSSGSTSLSLADLPATSGVHANDGTLAVVTDHQIHGSWCYYYGRNHPS